mmetsp:Transcript_15141/g.19959  ORF Transcript_15141/g.19959 Transcript_15141/m.19959 type:complete len:562 (+) Transcript_15141:51-1736(+)
MKTHEQNVKQQLKTESQDFDFTSLLSQIEDGKFSSVLSEAILNDIDKDTEIFSMSDEGEHKVAPLLRNTELPKVPPTHNSMNQMNVIEKMKKPQIIPLPPPQNSYKTSLDESLTTADFLRAQSSMRMDHPYNHLDINTQRTHRRMGEPLMATKKRVRKQDRTPEEKIQSKRERNRQHARNTRVRKKAYIENLKRTVDSLLKAKVSQEAEQKLEADCRAHRKMQRYKVLTCFMNYRVTGVVDPNKWNAILEPGFICVLPVTPYRSYPKTEIQANRRTIIGTIGMQVEAQSIQLFLESIGRGSEQWQRTFNLPKYDRHQWTTKLVCNIPNESFIAPDSDVIVAKWKFQTVHAVGNGSSSEIEVDGMAYCTFSMFNKLSKIELCFDVLGTIQSLKDALGPRLMNTIPQTIEKAKKESREPVAITEAKAPYNIVFVNEKWSELFGYGMEEIIGEPLSIIEGLKTENDELSNLMRSVEMGQPCSAVTHTYKKDKESFKSYLRMYPLLSAESTASHFLGYFELIPDLPPSVFHTAPPVQKSPMPFIAPSQTIPQEYAIPESTGSIPI